MNEDQLTRLRNQLQRRRQRLEATTQVYFHQSLARFLRYLRTNPFLGAVLGELKAKQSGSNNSTLFLAAVSHPSSIETARNHFDSPTQEDHVALLYHLLEYEAQDSNNLVRITKALFGLETLQAYLTNYHGIKNEVLLPFCDYLEERLDEQQTIVGLFIRYKKRSEWFNRSELNRLAQDEQARKGDTGKRAQIERVLKDDLYRYLHDQGLEFTIEPKSDRGEIDVILDQPIRGRTHLEVKVFDNDGRDSAYIISGFGQLLHYLRQYNASEGYLLVYRTCEESLVIEGAKQEMQIPYVECESKVIRILQLDICQYQQAVSARKHTRVSIPVDRLCKAEPG